MENGRYPCGCCGRGVGKNSVWCAGCEWWCYQRCSGVRDVHRAGVDFRCLTCVGGGWREGGCEASANEWSPCRNSGQLLLPWECHMMWRRSRSCSEREDSLCLEELEGPGKLITYIYIYIYIYIHTHRVEALYNELIQPRLILPNKNFC